MAELRVGGDDDLVLLINAAGLKLIVIFSGKRADHGVRGRIEFRRGDIVGEVLMNAAGKQIGCVEHEFLADLLIDPNAALHAERGVKMGIDIVEGWDRRGGLRQGAWRCSGIRIIEIRIVDHVTLLIDSVLVDGLHDVGCPGGRSK